MRFILVFVLVKIFFICDVLEQREITSLYFGERDLEKAKQLLTSGSHMPLESNEDHDEFLTGLNFGRNNL